MCNDTEIKEIRIFIDLMTELNKENDPLTIQTVVVMKLGFYTGLKFKTLVGLKPSDITFNPRKTPILIAGYEVGAAKKALKKYLAWLSSNSPNSTLLFPSLTYEKIIQRQLKKHKYDYKGIQILGRKHFYYSQSRINLSEETLFNMIADHFQISFDWACRTRFQPLSITKYKPRESLLEQAKDEIRWTREWSTKREQYIKKLKSIYRRMKKTDDRQEVERLATAAGIVL
ncbi:MAG: hypothetical protein P9L94_20335 [Candidatus Hinthialibacter antarcticus]|nr:hypothetical protein [Candidatus Hinthialibacter antarcticus]